MTFAQWLPLLAAALAACGAPPAAGSPVVAGPPAPAVPAVEGRVNPASVFDGVSPGPSTQAGPQPSSEERASQGLVGSSSCAFPAEADADGIDGALVQLRVTVRADGSVQSVSVVHDPGHGFGRVAQECMLAHRYRPALDRNGAPILSSTLVNVRFSR